MARPETTSASSRVTNARATPGPGGSMAPTPDSHTSIPPHHTLAPRVGATEPAVARALQHLQTAGHLDLLHHVIAGLQRGDRGRREAAALEQGRTVQAAEVG